MKPKTMVLMVVAVGCGLGASYMTSKLLAERNAKPQEVQTVPVLVAKVRVAGWQPIKEPEKMFEVKMFPVDVAPKRAIGSFADLKDQRLNKPLDETKPVTLDDLLSKEQQTLTDQLQPGQRAVAIKVTTEGIVGGFVLPGSRVDVLCTTRGAEASSKIVLQNMLVLAVDAQDTRNPEQRNMIAQTVTVAATPAEAARLALAQAVGELRLVLKNGGDTATVGHVIVKAGDLNRPHNENGAEGGEKPAETASPAPAPAANPLPVLPADNTGPMVEEPPVAPKPQRRRHVMTIQNGTQREKATFVEGDPEEEVASSEAVAPPENTTDEKPPEKKKAEKPKADKAADKPADKGAAFGPKTTRTKRIQ